MGCKDVVRSTKDVWVLPAGKRNSQIFYEHKLYFLLYKNIFLLEQFGTTSSKMKSFYFLGA